MDRLPYSELEKRVADARAFIAPGSRWKHYKGGFYVVVDVTLFERTDEVGVVYRPVDHPTVTFVRALSEWQDGIEYEGNTVFRFQMVN